MLYADLATFSPNLFKGRRETILPNIYTINDGSPRNDLSFISYVTPSICGDTTGIFF